MSFRNELLLAVKFLFVFILYIYSILNVFSQENDDLYFNEKDRKANQTTTPLEININPNVPNGIYASLSALAKGQIIPGYKIAYKNSPDSSQLWINLHQIMITPKLKNAKRFLWGFSDGTHYYINSKGYDPSGSLRYTKILYKGGKYSIFKAVTRLALPHQRSLAGLDMQNGKMFPISKNMVRELIGSNKEMLIDFERNAKTKNDFITYLIRFDFYLQQLHNTR